MTIIGYDSRIPPQSRRLPTVMKSVAAPAVAPLSASIGASLAAPLAALAAASRQMRSWQQRRATARALEAMPFDLRKDIGWPASDRPL